MFAINVQDRRVRWISFIGGVFVTIGIGFAQAADDGKSCPYTREQRVPPDSVAPGKSQLLTEKQCEEPEQDEVRVPLWERPQNGENPVSLSLGAKNSSGTLRLKIPFRF